MNDFVAYSQLRRKNFKADPLNIFLWILKRDFQFAAQLVLQESQNFVFRCRQIWQVIVQVLI
jgi:hypothetical protein